MPQGSRRHAVSFNIRRGGMLRIRDHAAHTQFDIHDFGNGLAGDLHLFRRVRFRAQDLTLESDNEHILFDIQ